ncbi:MAG TPA: ABC transporter permease [bacterium]|nr:ABC transporter permease [bacterium]
MSIPASAPPTLSAARPRAGSARRDIRRLVRRCWSAAFGALVLLGMITCALAAPWIAPYSPGQQDLLNSLLPPVWQPGGSWAHPFGTDQLGRDVLTWIIYGSRVSLVVGFSSVALSGAIGVVLGLVAGFYRRATDAVVMRLVEIQLAFPFVLMALLVAALFGQGLGKLILVLAVTGWATYARVVRAETLAAHERPYIEAARSLGLSNARIVLRHILPNILSPIVVIATFSVALMIIQEAALSFLGLGVPPSIPSWGGMLSDGRNYLAVAWWLGTLPGVAILIAVLGINLLGDWLRDVFDPTLRNT